MSLETFIISPKYFCVNFIKIKMKISSNLVEIFQASINEYHVKDSVDQTFENRFSKDQVFESMMYKKAWIDTVQWHLEDIIRKKAENNSI